MASRSRQSSMTKSSALMKSPILIQLQQQHSMLIYSPPSKASAQPHQHPIIHSNVIAIYLNITRFHLYRSNTIAFVLQRCFEYCVEVDGNLNHTIANHWNIVTLAHCWISFTASPVMQGRSGNIVGDNKRQIKWCAQTDITLAARHELYSITAAKVYLSLRCALWRVMISLFHSLYFHLDI